MGQGQQVVNGKWDRREGKMEITTRGNCVFVSGGLGRAFLSSFWEMAVLPAVCEFSDSGKLDSGLTFSVPGISNLLSWVLSYQRSRYSVEPCEWTPMVTR